MQMNLLHKVSLKIYSRAASVSGDMKPVPCVRSWLGRTGTTGQSGRRALKVQPGTWETSE